MEVLFGSWRIVFCLVPAVLVLAVALRVRLKSRKTGAITLNMAVFGGILIVLEIVLILTCQIVTGAMYREIALLVSLFMAGMATGGAVGRKVSKSTKCPAFVLISAQLAISAYVILLIPCLFFLKDLHVADISTSLVFLASAFIGGLLGGFQFAAAVSARMENEGEPAGATLYAADLIGSAAGAMIGSIFLLPAVGIIKTLLILSVTGLAACTGMLPKRDP